MEYIYYIVSTNDIMLYWIEYIQHSNHSILIDDKSDIRCLYGT